MAYCAALLFENPKFFRVRKTGLVLGRCSVLEIFWVVMMPKRKRKKEDSVVAKREDVDFFIIGHCSFMGILVGFRFFRFKGLVLSGYLF